MEKTIGYWLQRAARQHRALTAEALQDLKLFAGQEQVLLVLAQGDAQTVGDLAQALKVRPPTVSKTLQRLAAQKLVERREHGADARKSTVHLTKDGASRASTLADRMAAVERALVADLDGKEERRLRKLLRRIAKSMAPGKAEPEGEGEDDAED